MKRNVPQQNNTTQLVILGVLAIGIALAVYWYWLRPSAQPNLNEGKKVAEQFLQQLQEGKADEAWNVTTAEFKSAQGKEAFVREVKPLKFLRQPLQFVSVQLVEIGEVPRSELLYRAESGETVRIVLGRESGQWKVDRCLW